MILESSAAIGYAVPCVPYCLFSKAKRRSNDKTLGKNVYTNKNQRSCELFFRWIREYFAL
jgi:hypothetical protein